MLLKQDFYFHSIAANRPLHIRVPDWGEPPYPVMYFFDGHNLFRDQDATYGRTSASANICPISAITAGCGGTGPWARPPWRG